MATIATDPQYSVEVCLIEKDIITFDFANFAILVQYDSYREINDFYLFDGNNYKKDFTNLWDPNIVHRTNYVKISLRAFGKIRNAFLKMPKSTILESNEWFELWDLLKANFPNQVEQYSHN